MPLPMPPARLRAPRSSSPSKRARARGATRRGGVRATSRPRRSKRAAARGAVGRRSRGSKAATRSPGARATSTTWSCPACSTAAPCARPCARGRIRRIELDPAFDWTRRRRSPTTATSPGENVVALIEDDQPLLARDEIRHAEEPILLRGARGPRARRGGARARCAIDVEPLEPVLTVEEALAQQGADLRRRQRLQGDPDRARRRRRAASPRPTSIVEGEYRCGHQEQLYIENNGMIAERTRGRRARGARLAPVPVLRAQGADARVRRCRAEKVRVIQTVTGGGFGGKEEYPSMIGGARRAAGVEERPAGQDRLRPPRGHRRHHQAAPGGDRACAPASQRDGTLVAHDDRHRDGRRRLRHAVAGGAVARRDPRGRRRTAARTCAIRARAVATNTPPNGAFRGFGAPQTQFAIECHMDAHRRRGSASTRSSCGGRTRYAMGDVTPTGPDAARERRRARGARAHREARRLDAQRARRAATPRENAAAERARAGAGRGARRGARRRRVRRGIGIVARLPRRRLHRQRRGEARLAARRSTSRPTGGRASWPRTPRSARARSPMFAQIVGETLGVPAGAGGGRDARHRRWCPTAGRPWRRAPCMVVGGLLEQCARRACASGSSCSPSGRSRDARDFQRVAQRFLRERGPLRVEQRYEKPPEIEWDDDHYRGDAYGVFSYAALRGRGRGGPRHRRDAAARRDDGAGHRQGDPSRAGGRPDRGRHGAGAGLGAARGGALEGRPRVEPPAHQLHHSDLGRHAADRRRDRRDPVLATGRSAPRASASCRWTRRRRRWWRRSRTRPARACARSR